MISRPVSLRYHKEVNFFANVCKVKPRSQLGFGVFFLAGDEGFEPPQTESESGVLPLHKSPIYA